MYDGRQGEVLYLNYFGTEIKLLQLALKKKTHVKYFLKIFFPQGDWGNWVSILYLKFSKVHCRPSGTLLDDRVKWTDSLLSEGSLEH